MAAAMTAPAVPIRGFGAAYEDLDADLNSVLLFVVRYADAAAVEAMDRGFASARELEGAARESALEKALYDGAFHAAIYAPNEAADEVWATVERMDPYGDPELAGLSEKGIAALEKLKEDREAGRLIEGGFGE